MNKIDYYRMFEDIMSKDTGCDKKVMLHCCCAPCASSCIEKLTSCYDITALYYNPNITDSDEYDKRFNELKKLLELMPLEHGAACIGADYDKRVFFDAVKGYESCKEGGERCFICYELRLREAARMAIEQSCDYFATTLTLSPLKNAGIINEIGFKLEKEYGVSYLPSDFKKRDGYKRSIELSKEYGLYRQNYCGCVFSKNVSENFLKENQKNTCKS